MKPLCTKVTIYARDDMDFLSYIPQTVPRDTILVTFDVSSLYTYIPHNLGLEAIQDWLDKHPNRFLKEFILDGLKLVLENNTFLFDDETTYR